MKKKITLMLAVLGVAATLTPVATAKVSGPAGGGQTCICLPAPSIQ
jgi:hypothetical protein